MKCVPVGEYLKTCYVQAMKKYIHFCKTCSTRWWNSFLPNIYISEETNVRNSVGKAVRNAKNA